MQMLFYPGNDRQPCRAEYGIALTHDDRITRADIVVIHSRRAGIGTTLINTPEGRNIVLNKILSTDLPGIRIDLVRFFVIVDSESPSLMKGFEYLIRVDFDDYKRKGLPYRIESRPADSALGKILQMIGITQKVAIYAGTDAVCGGPKCTTGTATSMAVSPEQIRALCAAVGYERRGNTLPKWLANGFLTGSFSA